MEFASVYGTCLLRLINTASSTSLLDEGKKVADIEALMDLGV